MVVHALAFLVYYIVFILGVTTRYLTNSDENLSWPIDIVFGDFAYICLFFVMLHLGSSTKVENLPNSNSVKSD